jgi:hypothetical protein
MTATTGPEQGRRRLTELAVQAAREADGEFLEVRTALAGPARAEGLEVDSDDVEVEADLASARYLAEREFRAGRDPVSVQNLISDQVLHAGIGLDDPEIESIVGSVRDTLLREQRSWPATTDNDRLTAAFEALDAAGVVAREDFTCCSGCAISEIDDERDERDDESDDEPSAGFVYYHEQDTDRAAASGLLYLGFGAFSREGEPKPEHDERNRVVGMRVVEALSTQGLTADWDGDPGQRISLALTWRRRIA